MKTLKVLLTIALFAVISFSSFAQADDDPKVMYAKYESHEKHLGRTSDVAETEYMRNAFELKMVELNLDKLAYRIERSIKYKAPSAELTDAIDSLDYLMYKTELEIKYVATENNEGGN